MTIAFGPQVCGSLAEAASREWLLADGRGGYAMGTLAGLRTRRYHGLLCVPVRGGVRMLALAALEPVLVLADRRVRLATDEWADGTLDPSGHEHLAAFELEDGVPRWRWMLGDIVLEREIALAHGRSAVGVVHRLAHAGRPVRLELTALCTWRDAHGERLAAGDPELERVEGGFVFERAYRALGPAFAPAGTWYRGVRYRVEAERGLRDGEDVWAAGAFAAELAPGEALEVVAWSPPSDAATSASGIVAGARARARALAARAHATDARRAQLVRAGDQFVVDSGDGPAVYAGYPWFGEWSRDAMTAYEGLFLTTSRHDEGRRLLLRAAATLSEGLLANTTDPGLQEHNTVDATLWLVHAVGRHVSVAGDTELAAALADPLAEALEHYLAGTRFGIAADPRDGLLRQGEQGWALTWMDARVDGTPVTPRAGKPVEVNALWINALATLSELCQAAGRDGGRWSALADRATRSFARRFPGPGGGLIDVADGPAGDDSALRPNQLLAISLPHAPLADRGVVEAARAALLTPLGLRSLAPGDPRYLGRHRGGPAQRDRAYHQGTVWPWLAGPYVDAAVRTGIDPDGAIDPLLAHIDEWGLGSISETADGDAPHAATGCPFQAWSVAELLRALTLSERHRTQSGS
jgi:predicted glycogen debranching enzyme